jgi:hypothetical protein
MLQDRILSRDEFLRLLLISGATLDVRVHKREICFALGCQINAHVGEYLPLDAVAVLMTSKLSTEIGMKSAAELVREGWEPWLRAVQAAESDPRLYTTEPIDPAQHLYLAIGVTKDQPAFGVVGLMRDIMPQLNGYEAVRGISIQLVLRQLRVNARQARVALPARLTPPFDSPDIAQWHREIEAYQKASATRFKAKVKTKKAKVKTRQPALEARQPA